MSSWSSIPECVQDFEDQRHKYEACVYLSFLGVLLLVGLAIRCCSSTAVQQFWKHNGLDDAANELSDADKRTARMICGMAVCLFPAAVCVFVLAVAYLFPNCSCADPTACNICTLYFGGIPVGSCHKAATFLGSLFSLLYLVLTLCAWKKLRALSAASTTHHTDVRQAGRANNDPGDAEMVNPCVTRALLGVVFSESV